ncbi:helix-turn-helix transcriptional regulator [Sphingomonas sp. So64.6b]|nr:helix-turn-helix transcriptional regulator [Sphingomonas sp. So64.6b]
MRLRNGLNPPIQFRLSKGEPLTIAESIQREFGITQAAVSQHLRVLRDNGFARSRVDGARRIYSVDTGPLQDVDAWLDRFRAFWEPKLSALDTEIARGKKKRRMAQADSTPAPSDGNVVPDESLSGPARSFSSLK